MRQVASIIGGWGDVSAYTSQGQRELLLEGSVEKIRRQIGLFRILLTVIAAIIMALILYTLTLDKIHSIALLKLIGAPNRVILGLIMQQALVLGVLGFGIAWLLGQRVFPMFPRRVILTDEPTAALDSQRGRQVMGLFAQVAHDRGSGVVVVTHDQRAPCGPRGPFCRWTTKAGTCVAIHPAIT